LNRVAISGPMASGKSWVASLLVNQYGYRKIALADKLKEIAADLFEVKGKSSKERKILQELGNKIREIDPDIWVNYVVKKVGFEDNIVIDDVRYLNEARVLKENGFKLITITTPREVRLERIQKLYPDLDPKLMNHKSEKEYLHIESDIYLPSVDETTIRNIERLFG
jgi:dephospho-CoA kinase